MPTLAVITDDRRRNWTVQHFTGHDEAIVCRDAAKAVVDAFERGTVAVVVPVSSPEVAQRITEPEQESYQTAFSLRQDAADVVPVAETDEKP